ncbi:hypothetical protein [Thalassospira marina]|nr:hypothetical protein [Thalassospira marina]
MRALGEMWGYAGIAAALRLNWLGAAGAGSGRAEPRQVQADIAPFMRYGEGEDMVSEYRSPAIGAIGAIAVNDATFGTVRRAEDIYADQQGGRRALIVFSDAPDKWLLRVLPSSFRHCFAVLETGREGSWIYLNPASHQLECTLWQFSALFDPAAYYRSRGHRCLWVTLPKVREMRLGIGMASCVGVIKHLLGISAWWVVTPLGLYRYLESRSKIYQKSS